MIHSATVQKNLESIGFSEKEAKIYCAALLRDSFTLAEIAKYSGVNRSTCYLVVLELVKKGYLTQLPDVAISRFMVVDPKTVGKKLQEQVSKTQSILLDAAEVRAKMTDLPKVELFRGLDGARRIFDVVIEDDPKILDGIVNHSYTVEYLGEDFCANFINQRVKNNIFRRSLRPFEQVCKTEFQTNPHQLREVRTLPKDRNFNSVYYQWNEKVAFVSNRKEGISFIVNSKEFATLFKELFEVLWEVSEKQ